MKRRISAIIDIFWSVKLTITLLIILAIVSIIGTLLPLFPSQIAKYPLYSSWWFITLLFLLSINITVCSWKKLPPIRASALPYRKPFARSFIENLEHSLTFRFNGSRDGVIKMISTAFKLHRYPIVPLDPPAAATADTKLFITERGNLSRYSFYLTHISIVLILLGSLLGSLFGFKGYLQLAVGETKQKLFQQKTLTELSLPFAVRCDDFQLIYYQGTNKIKDYLCQLVVLEDGKAVKKKQIEVNNPLSYQGIRFYQSSYGQQPFNPHTGSLKLEISDPSGKELIQEIQARMDTPYTIGSENQKMTVELVNFVPDFVRDEEGQVHSRSQSMNNPAVQLKIQEDGELIDQFWIFAKFPDINMGKKKSPLHFEITFPAGNYYTGLQVVKDPGIPLVYLGGIILCIGLFMIFFWSHRRYYIIVEQQDSAGISVVIGAKTNKNRMALRNEFELITQIIQKEGSADDE
ncbi:cytochrome c biogenesis protein ResB [candidate division CSSED10-310 bacterium]|uniref:Cytochrome c biogenesis protein ResB n=1 Tax=candidate division CSSED10-310 bacterium TaxID=2855610 RepID=A0ABV6YWH7_UNCC1